MSIRSRTRGFMLDALVFVSLFILIFGLGLWAELLGIIVVLFFLVRRVFDLQGRADSLKKKLLFLLPTVVWVAIGFFVLWWGVQVAIELQPPGIIIDKGLWSYFKASTFALVSYQSFLLWLYGGPNVLLFFMMFLRDK